LVGCNCEGRTRSAGVCGPSLLSIVQSLRDAAAADTQRVNNSQSRDPCCTSRCPVMVVTVKVPTPAASGVLEAPEHRRKSGLTSTPVE
jgi:hypothetical protein